MADAFLNKYDTALVLSGDIDIVPSVEVIRTELPQKRIIALFPPLRACDEMKKIVHGYMHITEKELKPSLLPEAIPKIGGYVLRCPTKWH